MTHAIRTTCPYCGVGCGVSAGRDDTGTIRIEGDAAHPANFGRLCSKGSALAETLDERERLLFPSVRGERVGWDTALDTVARGLADTIREHGSESVAFYASGQLLTEDYYVLNKFVKGWLGTANIDTNSRLCMSSSVAGQRRAFGSDTVPGTYGDLEEADRVILVGSNLAWCHPVLFQRLEAARARRPGLRVVLVDPRRTATAAIADHHLALRPGSDAILFSGLLDWLARHDAIDDAYTAAHVAGLADALRAARPSNLEGVAAATGLSVAALREFYQGFAATPKTVTLFSQGVNQAENGTDTVNAIINCHLATGRIGRPGAGPLSITGQPNAMGGREVGGLSNLLAAHLELGNPGHRQLLQRFWGSPRMAQRPGLKAVELFDAVEDGRIRALWILGTNPVNSLPDGHRVERALARCPLSIVSDVVASGDTVRHATVRLPARAWGEKDGTVTNSERRVSRQRALQVPHGEARADWWALCQVARRLGYAEAFDYDGPAAIFREHAALSATDNDGTRDFDIGACATLDDAGYDSLEPFQWPWRQGEAPATSRFFADGRFFTPDGRARMVAIEPVRPDRRVDDTFPLVLNTGRVRDQWHTMTRTGLSPRLSLHIGEPFVEIHPLDAETHGIGDADIVSVRSATGYVLVRALRTDRQRRGSVFVALHWSDRYASRARVNTLVGAVTDPVSGQPASKSEAVSMVRWPAAGHALLMIAGRATAQLRHARDAVAEYWATSTVEHGEKLEMASARAPAVLFERLSECLPSGADVQRVTLGSAAHGEYRVAVFRGTRLLATLFVGATPVVASRAWLAGRFGQALEAPAVRRAVLAGRGGADAPDIGSIVCSCLGVGRVQITDARDRDGCRTVAAIGARLGAGTHCGSCRSEIRTLLESSASAATGGRSNGTVEAVATDDVKAGDTMAAQLS